MAVNALGIDLMLPALPSIGRELKVSIPRDLQWIVFTYMIGFGVGQLVLGPLSDRLGRRPVLAGALAGLVVATLVAASAPTFDILIAARLVQGTVAAAARVVPLAVVRDCRSGREMARIISLGQMLFFFVPVAAPSLGQALLEIGSWHILLFLLAIIDLTALGWTILRLPETRSSGRPLKANNLTLSSYRVVLTDRRSIGFSLAGGMVFGGVIAFISCCCPLKA